MIRFVAICLLALTVSVAQAALRDRLGDLVKADSPVGNSQFERDGVRITYLGTNGYLLEANGATILIDPYFSRQSLLRCALKLRTIGSPDLVNDWLEHTPHVDAILVTHGHVDHLYDAPQILARTGAHLYASHRAVQTVESLGLPRRQLHAVAPGAVIRIGSASLLVLRATHDRVLGRVPFPDPPKRIPPVTVDDWTVGEPLSFLIRIGGKRIYVNSGSLPDDVPPSTLGRVDLAILGVATPDSIRAFPKALSRLRPARVLPSHQDNFFAPLSDEFHFLAGTDFPRVRRIAQEQGRQLILLDYFQPWTLR